jgi:hypothetical protein
MGFGDDAPANAKAAQQGRETDTRGQATTRDSATDTGEDSDAVLVPARRKLGKEKDTLRSTATAIQSKSASRTGSPVPSVPRSHAPAAATRRGVSSKHPLSDSGSPPRQNKRERAKGQGCSNDDSDDGAKGGESKRRGTKQPVKRVGRRF